MNRLTDIPALTAALTPALLAATLLSLAAPGCTARAGLTTGGTDAADAVDAADAADASDTADASTDTGSSSGDSDSSDTADSADATDTADDSNEDGAGFLDDFDDTMPEPEQCDFWAQDCPEGQKCTWASSIPGGGTWDTICVDAGTAAPMESCMKVPDQDPYDATDTCDVSGLCYNIDPDTGVGTCIEMCSGSPDNAGCPVTGWECKQNGSGVLPLCLPECTPLPETCPECVDCPDGQNCVAALVGDTLVGFICFPPAAEGTIGESCQCTNCCATGLMCTDAEVYGQGCAYDLCCTEFCDITDLAFTCAGSGQQCVALFESTDPVWANVGACMVP